MYSTLKKHIRPVLTTATADFALFQDKLGGRMGPKLQSEIISALLENAMVKHIPNCRGGAGDHEADVYIRNVPLELKTSRASREWRGGEFSKRSGDFLLVSWNVTDSLVWNAIHVQLQSSDWKSAQSANYYATAIDLDTVLSLGGKVLVGDVRTAKIRKHPIYESVG